LSGSSALNRKRLLPRSDVHYRLIRPSDSDFLWEQDINGNFFSGRLRNSLLVEGLPRRIPTSPAHVSERLPQGPVPLGRRHENTPRAAPFW
ncbi:MAG: hypothetical protein O3C57_05755, partial [Verrucomicrobia bacterium]|nr:hypothetical protein [Verrucomicrobiota bacterium]